MLGINIRGNNIYINPCLPTELAGYTAQISSRGSVFNISVKIGPENKIIIDGEESMDIVLDGKNHDIVVITNNKSHN